MGKWVLGEEKKLNHLRERERDKKRESVGRGGKEEREKNGHVSSSQWFHA